MYYPTCSVNRSNEVYIHHTDLNGSSIVICVRAQNVFLKARLLDIKEAASKKGAYRIVIVLVY